MKKGDKVKLRKDSNFYSQCPNGIGTIIKDGKVSTELFEFRVEWPNKHSNNYREKDLELAELIENYEVY
jgi:hypothetical protein